MALAARVRRKHVGGDFLIGQHGRAVRMVILTVHTGANQDRIRVYIEQRLRVYPREGPMVRGGQDISRELAPKERD